MTETPPRKPRGFAAMSPERQKALASLGGQKAHAIGSAHKWSSDEARMAGRKGGLLSGGGRGRTAQTAADPRVKAIEEEQRLLAEAREREQLALVHVRLAPGRCVSWCPACNKQGR